MSIKSLIIDFSVFCAFIVSFSAHAQTERSLNNCAWRLQRSCDNANGIEISQADYDDRDWHSAVVPGTVLNSFIASGDFLDPNYGDQQLLIPDSLFNSDFWYRTEFFVDATDAKERVWLNFDGINWKADIYLNGKEIGNIKGAYTHKRIEVTNSLNINDKNVLAVLIHKNDNPGEVTVQHLNDPDPNGGVIGKDSPTILASIGWNWMPTIRGRNIGIWNDVYLTYSGDVTIDDPAIRTILPLPNVNEADIIIDAEIINHSDMPKNGTLVGRYDDKIFEYPMKLEANQRKKVKLTPKDLSALKLQNPKLWWPNGYGEQPMYQMELSFVDADKVSDSKSINFGVRLYAYSIENDVLRISVNGVPLLLRGGNWGMAESMLRCDGAGYDLRVKLHKEMNLNIIRNWIGMVGDDEFYDACDKYGIMVWDDFWLANPVDGPHPDDEIMFMDNVIDKIKHFRNHPSIVLWNGRNEGYPPASLDSAMRIETSRLDGTRYYLSHSAASPVSGLGPYENKDPKWYFQNRGLTLHSEQGIVVPPTLEGMKAMMPSEYLWPINDMWGIHDWTQERVQVYTDDMVNNYGEPTSIEDFCRKAIMQNMESPKALMEAWQSNRGPGVLVWMSHPAWPSMICQTYDYYFEPTSAFFAFKNACEPLHILWRADTEMVQVANNTVAQYDNLVANVEVWDIDGNKVCQRSGTVDVLPNSVADIFSLSFPDDISDVHFIKLVLSDANGNLLSSNFYWRGKEYMNYRSMDNMSQAKLSMGVKQIDSDDDLIINDVFVENIGQPVAVMLRIIVLDKKTGQRILPINYEDNYFSLVPGESRNIKVSFDKNNINGPYEFYLEGWNLKRKKIK